MNLNKFQTKAQTSTKAISSHAAGLAQLAGEIIRHRFGSVIVIEGKQRHRKRRRKRNTTPHITTSTPRKSSAMKGSTMAFIGKRWRRTPEPYRAPGSIGRYWLCQKPKRLSESLPRLLLPDPNASGEKWPRRREELHRKRQNDRGYRFRGLSGGIQIVRRDDIHRVDGVVYQKDLGKKTDTHAKNIKEYNPNSSWRKAEEQQEGIASQE
jgi:hypothetical protein